MLQNLLRWNLAVLLENRSRWLIDLRQLCTVEALWVKAVFDGGLELGIRMHDRS